MKNKDDMIKWLTALKADIGQGQYQGLWQSAEILDIVVKYLEASEPVQPQGDLISREDAIEKLESLMKYMENEIEDAKIHPENYTKNFIRGMEEQVVGVAHAAHEIIDMPSAEIVHGEWVKEEEHGDLWVCDMCGFANEYDDNFCPNCGTMMDGGK